MIGEPRIGWVLRHSYLCADDRQAGAEEAERAELERALDYVRGGDTLVVTKVDRWLDDRPVGDREAA